MKIVFPPAARRVMIAGLGLVTGAMTWGTVAHGADLDVTAFGARPDDGSDTTPAINKALEQCRTNGATRLIFPKGRYDFWPEGAAERHYFISNNDEGLKRIAFPLRGFKDLEIDGQGSAFVFHGYLRFWFEQGGVRDCVIRNNTFDNCNYGVWGKAAIEVAAGIDPAERAVSRYNQNIRIEGNLFRVFDPRLIKAYCVDGLVFSDNRIERTTDYPAQNAEDRPFDLEQCDRVQVEPPREIVR